MSTSSSVPTLSQAHTRNADDGLVGTPNQDEAHLNQEQVVRVATAGHVNFGRPKGDRDILSAEEIVQA